MLPLKPKKTNFDNRWMNENKYSYSLGHRGMKGDHKDEKCCHAIKDFVEVKNLGKGGCGGGGGMWNGGCGNSRALKSPIKIGHLLDV
jgi:hypothetical protein